MKITVRFFLAVIASISFPLVAQAKDPLGDPQLAIPKSLVSLINHCLETRRCKDIGYSFTPQLTMTFISASNPTETYRVRRVVQNDPNGPDNPAIVIERDMSGASDTERIHYMYFREGDGQLITARIFTWEGCWYGGERSESMLYVPIGDPRSFEGLRLKSFWWLSVEAANGDLRSALVAP